MSSDSNKTLVLGLGNVIMGDEGVGVHVVRALEKQTLPANVECLDGGTGGFILLEPLQAADHIVLIDATDDGNARRARLRAPRHAFPRTIPRHSPRMTSASKTCWTLSTCRAASAR